MEAYATIRKRQVLRIVIEECDIDSAVRQTSKNCKESKKIKTRLKPLSRNNIFYMSNPLQKMYGKLRGRCLDFTANDFTKAAGQALCGKIRLLLYKSIPHRSFIAAFMTTKNRRFSPSIPPFYCFFAAIIVLS